MTVIDNAIPTTSPARLQAAAPAVGRLSSTTPDVMVLHTRAAWQLFTGRQSDSEGKRPAIVGARRFAAILRSMWDLSGNDNPYADWLLIRLYSRLEAMRAMLEEQIEQNERSLDAIRQRGMTLSLLGSNPPVTVRLDFGSPYGFATAETVLAFDRHVRVVRTLVSRDRMSGEAGQKAIRDFQSSLRGLFLEPIRWERALLRDDLAALGRRDFLPDADEAATLRVRTVMSLLGEIPPKVITGEMQPRHTRRRAKLSPADVRALREALDRLAIEAIADPRAGLL